ncbi:xylulose 5-phosphate/phosphate translocator, chloroplastic-like [Phalaenopsis equestris]|uniref:xylulose 5-phosphate/phosphate translocator, chloroplastic-like n=1 Tax=Phalaenopsis equestris TaxID=78828 RepID=UPI0009E3D33A|nr:xylulose 5-phosphate/phosphate translocator, chloroplastic-like [Phalaenopsis equestris]
MLAFHALHPFTPRPDLPLTRLTRTHNLTHHISFSLLRRTTSTAKLVGIPKAAAAPENINFSGEKKPSVKINHNFLAVKPQAKNNRVKLAAIFGLWYFQNVIFYIYTKKALTFFPYPWLLASFQLLMSSLWMAALWATRLHRLPPVNREFFLALLGPAFFHAVGHISAMISFSKLTVSFTQVIKASEPVFSVIFSALHGHFYPIHIWLSVIPIVAGCSLAAATEVSLNAAGLWSALISNIGFVLRNIYSKQSFNEFKHVDGINLNGWICVASLFFVFPVAFVVEGSQWVQGYRAAIVRVGSPELFCAWVLLSGLFYHVCNQGLYQVWNEGSRVSFSVGDGMKRVVVFIVSVIVFGNAVRPLNALGSAMAIFGTFLYSQARAVGKKSEKKRGMRACW